MQPAATSRATSNTGAGGVSRRRVSAAFCAFVIFLAPAVLCAQVAPSNNGPEYPVVIDPGHGGTEVKRKDDKWDPVSKTFLDAYSTGTADRATSLTEHEAVLALGKRVRFYLELTQSQDGWKQFEAILRQFSADKEFKRIRFRANMSREDSWLNRKESADSPDVNAPFRLYDSYDSKGRFAPGRISAVNSYKPYLVVALHMNPA
ncbi:MAG: hypothetical protein HY042_10455, partial [Spirochaetia bacterium]|nr:hypothetical protein [Spirochaetia bacterium]